MDTAVYVTNRVMSASCPNNTAVEVCFGIKPNLYHMRVFGLKGYAIIVKSKTSRYAQEAFRCMFWGTHVTGRDTVLGILTLIKLELTWSVTLQELPKSKYVQVIGDLYVAADIVQ